MLIPATASAQVPAATASLPTHPTITAIPMSRPAATITETAADSATMPVPTLESYLKLRSRRTPAFGDVPLPSLITNTTQDKDGKADAAVVLTPMSLGECISVALVNQPSLKAVQASQQATAIGYQALQNIGRVGRLLRPDLPIRQQQACRGITAAAADVQKIHNEVIYDVTRLYYTVVYARQQQMVADDVVAQLEELLKIAEALLKSPMPGEMNALKFSSMKIGLAKAQRMQMMARIGQKQAQAALYEAMGTTAELMPFQVKDAELPIMSQKVDLTKEMIVQFAVDRRPELALAAAGVDAFRLEVYAQSKMHFRRSVLTFASGSDLHAHAVPQTLRDRDYRPGAIEPEMPNQLVGTPSERAARASAYAQRAESVFEKARNLIQLEAETSYLRFQETAEWVTLNKGKYDEGNKLAELSRQGQENIKAKDQLVLNEVLAAEAKSDYVEAVYQHLISLATLERVTAGAVQPAFPGR